MANLDNSIPVDRFLRKLVAFEFEELFVHSSRTGRYEDLEVVVFVRLIQQYAGEDR